VKIGNDIAISQNNLDLVKVEPNSDNETYLTSYHDGNEFIAVKVEEDKFIEEEDPLRLKFPEVKAEHEVGTCVPVLGRFHEYTHKTFVFSICDSLSVHMK
jgi:urease accessory protein UreE